MTNTNVTPATKPESSFHKNLPYVVVAAPFAIILTTLVILFT